MGNNVGMVGRLTKKQTGRHHFSDIPVGTLFLVIEEYSGTEYYDLLGYFLGYLPYTHPSGRHQFTGLIEAGTYEIIGSTLACAHNIMQATRDRIIQEKPADGITEA